MAKHIARPFDARNIDKVVVCCGAGTQSSAMAIMAAVKDPDFIEALIAAGSRAPDVAIFADPGLESVGTMRHLARLQSFCIDRGLPFVVTSARETLRDELLGTGTHLSTPPAFYEKVDGSAGMVPRGCTRDKKIRPIATAIRRLMGRRRLTHNNRVDVAIGITRDEFERAKTDSGYVWQQRLHPLIDMGMTRDDTIAYLDKMGFPDVPKSACVCCPYSSDASWVRRYLEGGVDWATAVEVDRSLQTAYKHGLFGLERPVFLHSSLEPIDIVIPRLAEAMLAGEDISTVEGWGGECEGICGI